MKLQQKRTATQVIIAHAHNANLTFFTNGQKYFFFFLLKNKKEKKKKLRPSRKNLESEDRINSRESDICTLNNLDATPLKSDRRNILFARVK